MNILFVHEIDWQRKVVFELHSLSEMLSLSGHNVYAIDYESMWEKGSVISKKQEMNVARAYPNAKVRLIRPSFIKIPIISRISAFITHYFAIRKVIKEKQIDAIILYSVPTNGLQTLCLAKRFNVPIIFRSIDNLHKLVPNLFLSKITYLMEKIVYPRVNLVLTISPQLAVYVKKLGASNVKILPLGVDTETFRLCMDTKELREKWSINENNKVVVFIGTLPVFSGLDTFICKFRHIVESVTEVKLLIVGDGKHRSSLEWLIKVYGLENKVVITGFQPYESIPQFINLADVCINTFPVSGATKDAFPTKVVQYMACGKPTVSTPLLGLKELGEKQGIVFTHELETEVIRLLKDKSLREKLGKLALEYAKNTHSYDKVLSQLEHELDLVVK